jgi:hypothetical protein
VDEGMCLADVRAVKKGSFFGKAVLVLSLGQGGDLPFNRFRCVGGVGWGCGCGCGGGTRGTCGGHVGWIPLSTAPGGGLGGGQEGPRRQAMGHGARNQGHSAGVGVRGVCGGCWTATRPCWCCARQTCRSTGSGGAGGARVDVHWAGGLCSTMAGVQRLG